MDNPEDIGDTIDSEEEAYRKFIVVCENGSDIESESGKENSPVKQFKTNRQQFDMMADFTNDNTEENFGKVAFDKLWEILTIDLNQIGPRKRTSMEWRRVWSVYKYNRKRKRSEQNDSNPANAPELNARDVPQSIARKACSDRKSSTRKSSARKKNVLGSGTVALGNNSNQETHPNINDYVAAAKPDRIVQPSVCDQIVARLDLLAEKHDEVLKNQVPIMKKIDKSNEFLEGILRKP